MNHTGTTRLETARLILRPFESSDIEFMFKNWACDSKVTKFLSWEAHREVETTESVVMNWISSYEALNVYNWAIELKSASEVIGNISIVKLEESNYSCEIGYCIGSKFWNKGIVTEAFGKIIEYLFSEVGFNRIVARHDVLNEASGVVMRKCNLKYEGTLREAAYKKGQFKSLSVYSILRSDLNIGGEQ